MDFELFNKLSQENKQRRNDALESEEITGSNFSYYIKRPLKTKNGNPCGIPSEEFWKLWTKNKTEMKKWIKVRKHVKLMLSKNTFMKDVYSIELQFRLKKEMADLE